MRTTALALLSTLLSACMVTGPEPPDAATGPFAAQDASSLPSPTGDAADRDVTAPNAPARPLLLMTWNLHWFGHPSEGPGDDDRQRAGVRDVLAGSGAALIALQEIASEPAFERLLAELTGYGSVLSGHDWVQRTALLWNTDAFEFLHARAISGLDDAGRPPLQVSLRNRADGSTWHVLVVHAKAQADAESHATRARFALALESHMRALPPTGHCVVLGDFNDALQGSITDGFMTPYAPFTNDTSRYATPTSIFHTERWTEPSYAWGKSIDHIVLDAALGVRVVPGSTDVLRDELLGRYPDFLDTLSDHFPVVLTIGR